MRRRGAGFGGWRDLARSGSLPARFRERECVEECSESRGESGGECSGVGWGRRGDAQAGCCRAGAPRSRMTRYLRRNDKKC